MMESKAKAGAAIVTMGTAAAAACFKLNAAPAAALDVETTAKKGSRRRRVITILWQLCVHEVSMLMSVCY